MAIDETTADEVNEQLGLDLFCRFWGPREDFFRHAFGFAVRHEGRVVSACYSAAIAEGIAEIDVATAGSARTDQPTFLGSTGGAGGLESR